MPDAEQGSMECQGAGPGVLKSRTVEVTWPYSSLADVQGLRTLGLQGIRLSASAWVKTRDRSKDGV